MNTIKEILLTHTTPSSYFNSLKESQNLDDFVELRNLIGVPQSPIHHPEGDVWTHTMLVLDEAAKLKDSTSNPYGFMLTALFHDLGKAEKTTIEEDGRIRSIGHENCIHLVKQALHRLKIDQETIEYVCNMVKYHMRPNALVAQHSSQKAFNKLFSLSIAPHDLILFSKADHLGRANIDSYEEFEKILNEKLQVFIDLNL